MRPVVGALAAAALMPLACSGTSSSPDGASDGASGGICSANVPAYQPCNTLANIASLVTPTCVTEAMPTGTGGTIVDGMYVLTSQTFYNDSSCDSHLPIRETIVMSDGCYQAVLGDDMGVVGTASVSFAIQGNDVTSRLSCADYLALDGGGYMFDVPTKTFTASPTTYTLFTPNSAAGNSNPDRIDVFTKL